MCSYLKDTWKKIKEDSPSKENMAKATGAVVLTYASILVYYHRKSIAEFVSEKTRNATEYLRCKSCDSSLDKNASSDKNESLDSVSQASDD